MVEIFETIEGEGLRAGFPTVFVRVFHCNLRCTWCDTPYSYAPAKPEFEASIQEIAEQVKTYSGGMKRRVNMASAMLHEPEVLIMDEPTVGIDPQSRSHILETIQQLNREKGLTVLYTSHYMEEVERLCDRVYIMDHGRVIASGTKEELKNILSGEETIWIDLEHPSQDLTTELRSYEGILQVSETEKGLKLTVPQGSKVLGTVFQVAERLEAQVVHVQVQTPTLEDVFLHMTGRKLRD
jgi:ABC-2 type transport system ATP-binding protein